MRRRRKQLSLGNEKRIYSEVTGGAQSVAKPRLGVAVAVRPHGGYDQLRWKGVRGCPLASSECHSYSAMVSGMY